MYIRTRHNIDRYFKEYSDRFLPSEEIEAFLVNNETVKISLLFEESEYYFEVSNFESIAVQIALYKSRNIHSSKRELLEVKQYTFNRAQAKTVNDFRDALKSLNKIF